MWFLWFYMLPIIAWLLIRWLNAKWPTQGGEWAVCDWFQIVGASYPLDDVWIRGVQIAFASMLIFFVIGTGISMKMISRRYSLASNPYMYTYGKINCNYCFRSIILGSKVPEQHIYWSIMICFLFEGNAGFVSWDSLIYGPLGCCKEVPPRQPLLNHLRYTGTLPSSCKHVIKTRDLRTICRVPDSYMWRRRGEVSTPGIAFRLLVPHIKALPGYMQSVRELCATVRSSSTFTPSDPVWRPNSHGTATSSPSVVKVVVSTPSQMENSEEPISPILWWLPSTHR